MNPRGLIYDTTNTYGYGGLVSHIYLAASRTREKSSPGLASLRRAAATSAAARRASPAADALFTGIPFRPFHFSPAIRNQILQFVSNVRRCACVCFDACAHRAKIMRYLIARSNCIASVQPNPLQAHRRERPARSRAARYLTYCTTAWTNWGFDSAGAVASFDVK
ncbi:hypothetical protein EVAR_93117_1 [Eumeta japonica]|uniref:Uncharacterized protein n=1 Tax=Eumeta variegata TaxID=151549 RepID=A0A4C1TGB7_EUMVA|nr:hypothetical protein EVAR_93117_1 [Eumeta japonica]